jgi:hypothetical protein
MAAIAARTDCKEPLAVLPVLTYLNVRCAPVLANAPFRLVLATIPTIVDMHEFAGGAK